MVIKGVYEKYEEDNKLTFKFFRNRISPKIVVIHTLYHTFASMINNRLLVGI